MIDTHWHLLAPIVKYWPSINEYCQLLTKIGFYLKVRSKNTKCSQQAWNAVTHGLVLAKHIRMLFILISIGYYTVLALNRAPTLAIILPWLFSLLGVNTSWFPLGGCLLPFRRHQSRGGPAVADASELLWAHAAAIGGAVLLRSNVQLPTKGH